ncbi:MAG: EamA family transporter [Pirellulaceae bacterium]|jgi:transporter family protein
MTSRVLGWNMQWILQSLLSALFLGLYDIAKKSAVRENAVPVVLLLNVVTAALIYLPLLLLSSSLPGILASTPFVVEPIGPSVHLLLFAKSALVGASWTLALFAFKHLPISIATPIRATSPLWTTLVAVVLMGERPTMVQWIGMLMILFAFISFSNVGKLEGIHRSTNRWVGYMIAATLLGSLSALYDKFLLQWMSIPPVTLQAWFSIYLVPVMLPLALRWYWKDRALQPFSWRWTIPAIAVCLLIADFLYFSALSDPDALLAIISPLRRTSVVIPFVFGIVILSEKNWKRKAALISLMLCGVALVSYKSA